MVPPAFFQTHQPEIEKMYFGVKVNALQFLSPLWVSSLISGAQFKRKLIFSTINVFSGFAFDMVTRTSPLCWNLQFHHQTWSQSLFLRALWGNFTARPPFFVFFVLGECFLWGNIFFGEPTLATLKTPLTGGEGQQHQGSAVLRLCSCHNFVAKIRG